MEKKKFSYKIFFFKKIKILFITEFSTGYNNLFYKSSKFGRDFSHFYCFEHGPLNGPSACTQPIIVCSKWPRGPTSLASRESIGCIPLLAAHSLGCLHPAAAVSTGLPSPGSRYTLPRG